MNGEWRSMALLILLSVASLCSCSFRSEHASFCEQNAAKLCARCFECGSSDAERSKRCGVLVEGDEAYCRQVLEQVCESNDEAFSTELATKCGERAEKVSCEQLQREGKPDACRRYF